MDRWKDVEAEPKDSVLVTFPNDDGWSFAEDGTYWLNVMLSYPGKPWSILSLLFLF
jgi:hypothetical protein